jgi:integrating conjugative element protein (TIGR03761 family)
VLPLTIYPAAAADQGVIALSQQDTEPSSPASEDQPGALRAVVTLTLETRQAQRMVKGRPGTSDKPAIMGLIGFANRLRVIWQGARADDPYADWWLVKIHDALDVTDQALQASLDAVQARLTGIEAISAAPGASVRPVRTPLRFSNPYAYRAAHLVAHYDRLVRGVLTAKHIGVIARDDAARVLAFGGRRLRCAFLSPLGYRLTGITRHDVRQGTGPYAKAQASMGVVPAEVLSSALRAPHAPDRPIPASGQVQHPDLQPPAENA